MKKYKISIWFLISLMMAMSVLSAVPVITSVSPVIANTSTFVSNAISIQGYSNDDNNLTNVSFTFIQPNGSTYLEYTNLTAYNDNLTWNLLWNLTNAVAYGEWMMDIVAMEEGGTDTTLEMNFTVTNCTPTWACSGYASCEVSDTKPCNSVIDSNGCNEVYGGSYSEFTRASCDFYVLDYVEEDLPEVVMNIMVTGLILIPPFITVIALVFLTIFVRKSFKK